MRPQRPRVRRGGPLLPVGIGRRLAGLEERASGALASTTTCCRRAGARRGRGRTPAPSGVVATAWAAKSTRASIPACSTTRRSCTSPHAAGGGGPQRAGRAAVACAAPRPSPHRLDLLAEPGALVHAVALEGADLLLDPLQRAGQRRQGGDELTVLRGGGLQVGDALAEQVALGGEPAGARPRQRPRHERARAAPPARPVSRARRSMAAAWQPAPTDPGPPPGHARAPTGHGPHARATDAGPTQEAPHGDPGRARPARPHRLRRRRRATRHGHGCLPRRRDRPAELDHGRAGGLFPDGADFVPLEDAEPSTAASARAWTPTR